MTYFGYSDHVLSCRSTKKETHTHTHTHTHMRKQSFVRIKYRTSSLIFPPESDNVEPFLCHIQAQLYANAHDEIIIWNSYLLP